MATSAYNLGNTGLAGKILRIKDLASLAAVEVFPVLRNGAVCFWLTLVFEAPDWKGAGAYPNLAYFGFFSKGCASQEWELFLWKAVEKGGVLSSVVS